MGVKSEIMLMLRWGYHRVENQNLKFWIFEKFKIITYSTLYEDHKNIIFKFLMFVVAKICER